MTHAVPSPTGHTARRMARHPLALACLGALAAPLLAQAQAQPAGQPEIPLQRVVVEASADASAQGLSKPYAGGQVARGGRVGLLGTQDMMDTPFNALNYTQSLIQDQQARSVADVLLNDPAVRNARGFGNFQELYVVRGFPLYSDDMAYNGLYGLLPRQYVAAELLERVEVFRGASAFLNGAAPGGSSLGGAINLLPKRAGNAPLTAVTLGVESGGQAMLGLDVSRRFGPDKATGLRVNAVTRQGDTAIDGESRQLGLLSVGADWRSRQVRLSADLGYQDHQQDAPRASVTPLGDIPEAPDAKGNATPGWTYANERQTFGTLRGEFDLSASTTAWAAFGVRQGVENNNLALISVGADGTGSGYRYVNAREDAVSTGELGLRTELQTGSIGHQLSASFSSFSIRSKNAYAFSDFFNGFVVDLDQPTPGAAPAANFFTGGVLASPKVTQRTQTRSVALADVMSLVDGRLRLALGARHQTIEDRTYNYNTGAQETAYDESRVTPMLGVLWKLSPATSLYANYIEGLVRGEVAPLTSGSNTVTNGGQAMSPYQTKQWEAGVKWDLGRLGGSFAVFKIDKPVGALRDNGNGTSTFVVADAQRHQGAELSLFGEATKGLKLLGGYSWIDAELSASGKQAIGVPRQQLNLGAEWTPAGQSDWALDARVVYTGSQWANAANSVAVPSWTRLDLGARWATEVAATPLTLRLRLDNALNRDYWASAGGYPGANYLVLGAPRTLTLSANLEF